MPCTAGETSAVIDFDGRVRACEMREPIGGSAKSRHELQRVLGVSGADSGNQADHVRSVLVLPCLFYPRQHALFLQDDASGSSEKLFFKKGLVGIQIKMDIHVAHSPDSDDAFMFYALATHKIDTGDLNYIHLLNDIETLNRKALKGEYEVSAISFHAYAYLADKYALLSCGASMGNNYGPIVVSGKPMQPQMLAEKTVAIPGMLTTAFLALASVRTRREVRSRAFRPHSRRRSERESTKRAC